MKAIVVTAFGGPGVLQYMDVEEPVPGPNQVLIRVERTGVNFADIKARLGKKGAGQLPFIPGLDAAGTIAAVGSAVSGFRVGQRVSAFPSRGSYAEWAVADDNLTFAVPDEVDMDTAAASLTVSILSCKLLADIARIQPGETVLVHSAAGGVGTTLIQVAKLLGAGQVIGTVGSEEKAAAAREAGADRVVCYETEDFAAKVIEWTHGEGADIVLDAVSGSVSERSMDCLAPYGRLVHYGNSGGGAGIIRTSDLHASCRSVLGYSLGTTRRNRPETLREAAERVFRWLADGSLKMKIGRRFALRNAAEAHVWVESRQSVGKVLLDVR